MLLEDLYFQQLHRIELVEPWRLDNGTPGLLAGAVLLHFEDGVLACWSPLRYGMRPTGTALGVSVNGVLTSPGYRLSVLPTEAGDKRFDLTSYRAGIPWRDLPARFGDFRVVHLRHSRWNKSGVWERLLQAPAQDTDNEYAMIDATIVRVHQYSAGAKEGGSLASHRTPPRRVEHQNPCHG